MKIKDNYFFFVSMFFYFMFSIEAMFGSIYLKEEFLSLITYVSILLWIFMENYFKDIAQHNSTKISTLLMFFLLITISLSWGVSACHYVPMLLLILNYIAYSGNRKQGINGFNRQTAQQETVMWQTAVMFFVLLLFALELQQGSPLYEQVRAVGGIWYWLSGYAMIVYLTLGGLACVVIVSTIYYAIQGLLQRRAVKARVSFSPVASVLTLSSCGFAFYLFSYSRTYLPTFFFWIFAGSIYYLYAYLPKVGFNLFAKTDETEHGYLLLQYSVLLSVCAIGYGVFYFYTLFQQPEVFAQTFLYNAKGDIKNVVRYIPISSDTLLLNFKVDLIGYGLIIILTRLFYFGFDISQYHIPALYNILFDPLTQMFAVFVLLLSIYVCWRSRVNNEKYKRWFKPLAFINIAVFFVPMFHTVAYKSFQYFSQFYAQSVVAGCALNYLLFLLATGWFYYRIYKEDY